MKSKISFVCNKCDAESPKWMGRCPSCGSWNTLEERTLLTKESDTSKQLLATDVELTKLGKVNIKDLKRVSTGLGELDLAIGGGFVSGQVVLFSGEPGVGKSTLLLQMLVGLSTKYSTLYVSGEESVSQTASRAARLFPKKKYKDINFMGSAGVNQLLTEIKELKPDYVVVDSIQTIFDENLNSLPGSLSQVKACTAALVRAAKIANFTLVIVGHINKSGSIAGPKVLEHLVDTVVQVEGDQGGEYRMVRALKNRFGPTGEVGLFEMTDKGLIDMDYKNNVLGGSKDASIGAAKTLAIEGSRSLLVEVQALTNETVFAYPKRVAEGISVSRLQLICAILDRFAKTKLGSKDVYVRTTGDYKLKNTTSDLAVAAAILSSLNKKEITSDTLYIGQLNLNGAVSIPGSAKAKLKGVSRFGIKNTIAPQDTKNNRLQDLLKS